MKKHIFLTTILSTCFMLGCSGSDHINEFRPQPSAEHPNIRMASRVDPELLEDFNGKPPIDFEKEGLEPVRNDCNSLIDSPYLPTDPEIKVYNVKIANSDNTGELRLRIYKPINPGKKIAGIYWIHGGGCLFGNPEVDEGQSLRFAKEVGAVVVSADYRLAPEHPYPAPPEDCYTGLKWFFENASELGVDDKRIAVAGASAGGGLCAAVTLMARDRKGPAIAFQMPLYPFIDDRDRLPSRNEELALGVWNKKANTYAWNAYLKGIGKYDVTPYMAPARETNLSGLPPAYSCVGELDLFRDDTIDYMARLARSGVATELHIYPGAYHAFEVTATKTQYAKRVVDEYVYVLRKALNK